MKLHLTVLCDRINVHQLLQPAAPLPAIPSLSVKQGPSQLSWSLKTFQEERKLNLTVPSCGKTLNDTGIIRPRTTATVM